MTELKIHYNLYIAQSNGITSFSLPTTQFTHKHWCRDKNHGETKRKACWKQSSYHKSIGQVKFESSEQPQHVLKHFKERGNHRELEFGDFGLNILVTAPMFVSELSCCGLGSQEEVTNTCVVYKFFSSTDMTTSL